MLPKVLKWFGHAGRSGGSDTPSAPVERVRRRLLLQDTDSVIYAIGDVHGCLRELLQAEERIFADAAHLTSFTIVMLGDYVDRGPASAEVLDHLVQPTPAHVRRICLVGNHDDAMLGFLTDPESGREWLDFGGRLTLQSYGLDLPPTPTRREVDEVRRLALKAVPPAHVQFLTDLPILLACRDYLFVHAGIVPGRALASQSDTDLMWIREPFLSHGPGLGFTVVHGHTPSRQPSIGPNRIGIDTAAYASGNLTVLKIDGTELCFV